MVNQQKNVEPILIKNGFEAEMKNIKNNNQYKLIDINRFMLSQDKKEQKTKKPVREDILDQEKLKAIMQDPNIDQQTKHLRVLEEVKKIKRHGDFLKTGEKNMLYNNETQSFENISSLKEDNELKGIDLENCSIEELKKIGFKEISATEYKINKEGNLIATNNDNDPMLPKLNKDLRDYENVNPINQNYTINENLSSEINKLVPNLIKNDKIRCDRVISALENGYEIDDPLYHIVLQGRPELLQMREQYLRIYYTGTPETEKAKRINEVMLNHKVQAQIYENNPNLFHKYDSEEGKGLVKMGQEYFKELEKEEKLNYQGTLGESNFEKDETSINFKDTMFNSRTYVNDRIRELYGDASPLNMDDEIVNQKSNNKNQIKSNKENNYEVSRKGEARKEEENISNTYLSGSQRSRKKNKLNV